MSNEPRASGPRDGPLAEYTAMTVVYSRSPTNRWAGVVLAARSCSTSMDLPHGTGSTSSQCLTWRRLGYIGCGRSAAG